MTAIISAEGTLFPQEVSVDTLSPQAPNSDGRICVKVRSASGAITPCYIHPDCTIRYLKNMIEVVESNHLSPDDQDIVVAARQLKDDLTLRECGITDGSTAYLIPVERVHGIWDGGVERAHAVALFDWDGSMQRPIVGLPLRRGQKIVISRILTPLWYEGNDLEDPTDKGRVSKPSVIPSCYVEIDKIFDRSFRQELANILPALSTIPISANTHEKTSNGKFAIHRRIIRKIGLSRDKSGGTTHEQQTSEHLDLSVTTSESKESKLEPTPPLPEFPYPEKISALYFRISSAGNSSNTTRTFAEVAVISKKLTSLTDTPLLSVILTCFPVHPMRLSAVTFSIDLEDNQIVEISPDEVILGPATNVQSSLTHTTTKGVQAGVTAGVQGQGANLTGSWSKDVGETSSSVYMTRSRIQGSIVGGGISALWTFTEDVGARSGLPSETELWVKARYKPRKVLFKGRMTIVNGANEKSFDVAKEGVFE